MTVVSEVFLVDYRDADFNKRLHLFLEYPELRSDFMAIDQEEEPLPMHKKLKPGEHHTPNPIRLFFTVVASYFKRTVL
jgi:hypothetical protein